MAFNAEDKFNLDLSLFGSKVTDLEPANLPAGAMPNSGEIMTFAGSYATRPAFIDELKDSINILLEKSNLQVTSLADFPLPDGDFYTMFEDSLGNLWKDDVAGQSGSPTSVVTTMTPGTYFRAATAFGKQFYASFSPTLASSFSDSPLAGVGVPIYYDGQNAWRVTQDSPGGGLAITSVNLSPSNLVGSGTWTSGPSIASVVSSGLQTSNVPNQGQSKGNNPINVYTTMTVTLSGSASLTAGQLVQLSGVTWTPSGGPQWGSGVAVQQVISGTQFTIAYSSSTAYTGTGGSSKISSTTTLTRTGNVVTAYLGGTTQYSPTSLQPGWFVNIVDGSASGGVPTGSMPNTTNQLFQAIGGGTATFTGNGEGTVTVTLGSPVNNMPVGCWVYYYTVPPPPVQLLGFSFPDNQHVTLSVASNPFQVGQQVQIIGAYVGNTPTFIGNPVLTITSVTTTSFTAYFLNGGGPQSLSQGTAQLLSAFGSGYAQVTQVLSNTQFQFFLPGNSVTSQQSGVVYDYLGSIGSAPSAPNTPAPASTNVVKGFQLLSVDTQTGSGPNQITYYQLGPDNVYTGTDTLQAAPQTQVSPGPRNLAVFFYLQNGAVTGLSEPVSYNGNGGSSFAMVTLPLGPPGCVGRGVAFTPAYGDNYYAVAAGYSPATPGNGPVITTGTIVNDNYSVNVLMDFSDAQLTASTQLQVDSSGSEYGNLFNYTRLQPCLGVEQYQSRLAWWGQVNAIPNMVNLGFDGGYTPQTVGTLTTGSSGVLTWQGGATFSASNVGQQIALYGLPQPNVVLYTITSYTSSHSITVLPAPPSGYTTPFTVLNLAGAQPPGWTTTGGDGAGYLVQATPSYLGYSYQIPGGHNGMIEQSAYQDYWGSPILLPNHSYIVRFLAMSNQNGSAGNVAADIYSPTLGTLASGTIPMSGVSNGSYGWQVITLNAPMPASIPQDAVFRIYLAGTSEGLLLTIDEVEVIDAYSPVLYNQLIWSMVDNPFMYDDTLGVMGVPTSDYMSNAFLQRQYFMLQSNNSLFQTSDNGSDPNTWTVDLVATECGCSGPNATSAGEGIAWWVGRHGFRSFYGSEAKKLSQYVNMDFERTNWAYDVTSWVANDSIQREIRIGIPIGTAQSPSVIETMSYRLADSLYNVQDPVHVSLYSGKMICTDLGIKFTTWNIPMNCARMCSRPAANGAVSKVMVFAGGNGQAPGSGTCYGNLYIQDVVNYPPLNPNASSWNCKDADYGQIGLPSTSPTPLLPNMGNGTTIVSPIVTNNLAQTYFWFAHDTEQQAQGALGQHRKLYSFLAIHCTGVGYAQITPLADSYRSPLWTLPLTPLNLIDIGRDSEFILNHQSDRLSLMVQVVPIPEGQPGYTDGVSAAIWVTHMVLAGAKEQIFPIWGESAL